jgi:7-cyano-7-deazaguanine synthase in queuosine biosynthesis
MIKRHGTPERATAHIIAADHRTRRTNGAVPCILGEDVVVGPDALGRYCVHDLNDRVDDLVIIAGVVAFTDRAIARKPATAWQRHLQLTLPVHEPAAWRGLADALSSVLHQLTGDQWEFSFRKRTARTNVNPQATLPLAGQPSSVMPFSDGLDSLAVARLIKHREPESALILVTAGTQRCVATEHHQQRVTIPFNIPAGHLRLPETSFRSRAFVFGTMASVAAQLAGANRIIVPESGQSSLGPWLQPVGNEAPDIRTHPSFTKELGVLLGQVLGTAITFEHPQLWKTKGETLCEVHSHGLEDQWWLTRSCARRRHVSINGKSIQCGVCAACLLRRQSLQAAHLDESRDQYFWRDLKAPTLEQAAPANARNTKRNDARHAWCGILELDNLAKYARLCHDDHRFTRLTAELALTLEVSGSCVRNNLQRLLETHANEWQSYLSSLPHNSFLVRWLKEQS